MRHVFALPAGLVRALALALVSLASARPGHAAPGQADADAPAPTAKIDCPRVSEPGRVRCEIEVRPPPGTTLRWADVALVSTPPFAVALRARVGPREASAREETVWRWAIALAARARGEGDLAARAHVVACRGADSCAPYEVDVHARVTVGD